MFLTGRVDVVVCDGFVGNVLLKVSEGLAMAVSTLLKREIESRFLAKLGYLLSRPAFIAFKKKIIQPIMVGLCCLGLLELDCLSWKFRSEAISIAIRQAGEYAKVRIEEKLAALL